MSQTGPFSRNISVFDEKCFDIAPQAGSDDEANVLNSAMCMEMNMFVSVFSNAACPYESCRSPRTFGDHIRGYIAWQTTA